MTAAPAPDPAQIADTGEGSIITPHRITQAMVIAMTILCCFIFWWGSLLSGWPSAPAFTPSVMAPPATGAMVMAIACLILCTILGTLALSRRWFLAGLFVASAGMIVWSIRGGTVVPLLQEADTRGVGLAVFWRLLLEVLIYFTTIAILWNVLWRREFGVGQASVETAPNQSIDSGQVIVQTGRMLIYISTLVFRPRSALVRHNRSNMSALADQRGAEGARSTVAAIVVQSALMILFILIFVATPMKKQVLLSVFLSGWFSTSIADNFFADRRTARWYWVGPLAAAVLGYIANALSSATLPPGDGAGAFAALGRVLPLDYASAGIAGVLLGYWSFGATETTETAAPYELPVDAVGGA